MSRDLREQRRRFLKLAGSSAAVLPLAGLAGCGGGDDASPAPEPAASPAEAPTPEPSASANPAPEPAAEPPADAAASAGGLTPLSEDDPQAQALAYVNDASTVDASAYPQYQSGQICANCALFQGADGDAMGACSIFPGRLVNAQGWCSVYAPKA